MFKKFFAWSLLIITLQVAVSAGTPALPLFFEFDPLDRMPILEKKPIGVSLVYSPTEQRGIEYRKFLAASVKIGVNGSSGSGTIVYYDRTKNLAYVASCGHLWNKGSMSVDEGRRRNMQCRVIAYYHNDTKLSTPQTYEGDVIFYSFMDGTDTSLITFTPDWEPKYFPIAPVNYQYKFGSVAHSCGCDGGSEVAHYEVELINLGQDLITNRNGPRPGRSGGGLMDDNGFYIGTCWGTQYKDGSGQGFFTPLSAIHRFWGEQSGYEFLLTLRKGLAQKIPIVDRNDSQGEYDPEYILLPGH